MGHVPISIHPNFHSMDRKNPEVQKAYYEERLWKKAEELSELRINLQKKADDLFNHVQNKDVGAIGLYAEE